ncbi:MAG: NAD-dependent epimerase/dehydratase family protein [Ignavibacteriales bacterium]|nr:NAD-dependent epimerase/dehydratase family protein [Ignavibacteriales bacterium]
MKILVTGGAGFIASHIVDAYINAGHNVSVVDNLSTGFEKNVNPKAKFFKIDIRSEELQSVFAEFRPDIVNHHAAQMDVRKSVADPSFDAQINILGGINLLECCKEYDVKKFIFASTGGAIYGEQDYFPADEQHPQRPLSPYGIAKLTTEKYLFYYNQVFGLNYTALRYANVYGPRQSTMGEAGVVAIFASKLLKGEQPIINGDGMQTRDYVFVEDVVQANLLVLNDSASTEYNIGTGIETNVNELFNTIKKICNSNAEEKHGEAKAGEQKRSVLTSKKISEKLGWKQTVKVEEGLNRTVEYFKQLKMKSEK